MNRNRLTTAVRLQYKYSLYRLICQQSALIVYQAMVMRGCVGHERGATGNETEKLPRGREHGIICFVNVSRGQQGYAA